MYRKIGPTYSILVFFSIVLTYCTPSKDTSLETIIHNINQNKIHEAYQDILEFKADSSNRLEFLILKAQIFHELKMVDSAKYFVDIIDVNPDIKVSLLSFRANLFDLYSRNEDALLDYKRLTTKFPIDANNYASLANIFYKLNSLDSAEFYFRRAITLDKKGAVYYNNLAAVMCQKGDTMQGLHNYSEAIKHSPNSAVYYFNRGIILVERSEAKMALADFNKCISLDPLNDLAYMHAAILRINNNFLDENPCNLLKKAIDLGNREAEVYYNKMCK
jgi:tetratricopeptide (TPR) repeat protein